MKNTHAGTGRVRDHPVHLGGRSVSCWDKIGEVNHFSSYLCPRKKDLVSWTLLPVLGAPLVPLYCIASSCRKRSPLLHTPAETHSAGPRGDSIWTQCSGPVDLIYKLPSSTGGHPGQLQLP